MRHPISIGCHLCGGPVANKRNQQKRPFLVCGKCNSSPPAEYACKGTKTDGNPCGRWPITGIDFCYHHRPKGEAE